MVRIRFIPAAEFLRVRSAKLDRYDQLAVLADMCRANALAAVKRAGSGHLGSSLSAMDIVVYLYYAEMNTAQLGITDPNRDIYFSSKGHDVPGLYSVLYALGIIPEARFLRLRRLGGLDGHPDVGVPGIEANSGSLGMGISKARGMAWAKRYLNRDGRVFVMIGDGELQEGQNYEALQSTVHQRVNNLTVIVDHNKVQSDKPVSEIVDLGDLNCKFESFGWHVSRCNGHDYRKLEEVFSKFKGITDKPKVLVADTIKGRGVSFMEHPTALKAGGGLYPWHAGAPDDESFAIAHQELVERIDSRLAEGQLDPLAFLEPPPDQVLAKTLTTQNALGEPVSVAMSGNFSSEYVVEAYGKALVELAGRRRDLVVLDADLSTDCRTRYFENAYPERFIQNGIAEQDMVSMAGGLARQGLLPIVNSFASFLASRANEQIYNNNTEHTKIIYVCHYGGLIPAGPGKSHQSLRDISLLGALPNCVMLEPCNTKETRVALEYCITAAKNSCILRLIIGPSPRTIELPAEYDFRYGCGTALQEGADAIIFAYGPVMLNEALLAAEALAKEDFGLKVVNMPWLNAADPNWLRETVNSCSFIYVLEDHLTIGGLGDRLLRTLLKSRILGTKHFQVIGVEGNPVCGAPGEVLHHHELDGISLANRIHQDVRALSSSSRLP